MAIRTNCGRHGCWQIMRASMDRWRTTPVWPSWSRARCARFLVNRNQPHKVRYYLEGFANADFEQKNGRVLCVYREVQVLKRSPRHEKARQPVRSCPTTRRRYSGYRHDGRQICRPFPASTRLSRAIMSTNAMVTLACWPGWICSREVHALVRDRHRSREFVNSSSFSMPLIRPHRDQGDPRQSFRTHLQETSACLPPNSRPLRVHIHTKHGSWLNLIEGFFSSSPARSLRHIRVSSKHELSSVSWPLSKPQSPAPSSHMVLQAR